MGVPFKKAGTASRVVFRFPEEYLPEPVENRSWIKQLFSDSLSSQCEDYRLPLGLRSDCSEVLSEPQLSIPDRLNVLLFFWVQRTPFLTPCQYSGDINLFVCPRFHPYFSVHSIYQHFFVTT